MASLMNIEDFSGLDYRTKLNKASPTSCSDALNIVLNDSREIEKRNGSEEFDIYTPTTDQSLVKPIQAINYGLDDVITLYSFYTHNEPYPLNLMDAKIKSDTGDLPIVMAGGYWGGDYSNFKFSTCEYNNVTYFADNSDNNMDMLKFDGGSLYRAGIPKADTAYPSNTAVNYYRTFWSFEDAQGNEIFSDYDQSDKTDFLVGESIVSTTSEIGFYGIECVSDESKTMDSASPTLDVVAGHTIQVGQKIPFYTDESIATGKKSTRVLLEIISIVSDTITFSGLGDNKVTIASGDFVGCRYTVYVFTSTEQYTNYTFLGSKEFQAISLGIIASSFDFADIAADTTPNMEDIYDTQLIKGIPPKCRYIDMYNNVMIATGSFETNDQHNKMYWSDLSVGSTVETFTPFDFENIGVTSEGQITGIKSYFGRIAVFKLRSVYLIDGILTTRRYTVKNYFQNMVGCVNHFSIAAYGNGVVFMSERGIQSINGNTLTEVTDLIQPIFKDADLSESVVAIDQLRERMYFTFDSKIYVFDLYHKAWYVWSGIPTDDIMVADWGGKVRIIYTDKTNDRFAIEKDELNDFGVAISANHSSAWFDLDSPDLRKKFTELVIKSFNNSALNVNIKTEYDWTIGNTGTDMVKTTTDPIVSAQLNHDMVYSMRLILSNNTINENMKISGYSLEYATTQQETRVR